MIDPLPVGYISLDQAVTRLAANISDRDYQEEMRRFREHMRHLDHIRVEMQKADETGPTGQSQNEAETENRQSEEPENPDPARLLWGKRELAIAKLHRMNNTRQGPLAVRHGPSCTTKRPAAR